MLKPVESIYQPYDLVWAKQTGKPWWPAEVQDPLASSNDETQRLLKMRKTETQVFVLFFDPTREQRECAWIEADNLKPYRMYRKAFSLQELSPQYVETLPAAVILADKADKVLMGG